MKKAYLILAAALFSISIYASTNSLENTKEETFVVSPYFPVYCDGVYVGNASSIEEALKLC
ncbi:MAG: hypothetical protein ACK5MZ_07315 [Aestuariibaculum sp.]